MNKWTIRYWAETRTKSPVEKWLDKLTNDQFKSVAKELKILEEAGNDLRLPHSRSLGGSLFELREPKYGYRVYYGFRGRCVIILLAAGNKKSQKRDINVARKRLSKNR